MAYFVVFVRMRRLPGQLADQDAALVADRRPGRCARSWRVLRATACVCMPPLWAKALVPTNGWPERKFMLADLVDVARHLRQPGQAAGLQHVVAALERQVGDDADQVGVAAAFADAVDRALHLRRPAADARPACWPRPRRNRCGNGCPARTRSACRTSLDAVGDVVGQRAAVGVAQDHAPAPRRPGRPAAFAGRSRGCA